MDVDYSELLEIIRSRKFTIFGTGSVADRFVKAIKTLGYWHNVNGFAVTKIKKEETIIDGKPVIEIDEVARDETILVSVHNILLNEIVSILQKLEFQKFVWIYPYLFDLYFGLPVKYNLQINVRDTVRHLNGIYTHAVYYMAIENIFQRNFIGDKIYIKYMSIFCNKETAIQRWTSFKSRIECYNTSEKLQEYNIKLSKNFDLVLDGAHRLMLAYYFGKENIIADIYDCTLNQYLFFSGNVALTEGQLYKYFLYDEIELIKKTCLKLQI